MRFPPLRYVCVEDFIVQQCAGQRVLHLGCAGDFLAHGPEACLHVRMAKVSRSICGVEIDEAALARVRAWFPEDGDGRSRYVLGDVERLAELHLLPEFDVIVAGSIIEHLTNPGQMLAGIHDLARPDTRIIIVTPHVFGLLQYLRVALTRAEAVHLQHTCWFSIQTLGEMCRRYGLVPTVWLTGHGWQPASFSWGVKRRIGTAFFRVFPHLGGSLIGVFVRAPVAEARQ